MGRTCGTYGEEERRGAYMALVGQPEGRGPFERIILKWIIERLWGGGHGLNRCG
jgi:hypothetical protein